MMELHASKGQTIQGFAQELFNISEVADVEGVFNDIRIHVNMWDTPESLVKQYYDKINE